MKIFLLFIFSITSFILYSQDVSGIDSTENIENKNTVSFAIMVDYGKILTLPFKFENRIEGGFQGVFLKKYLVALALGTSTLSARQAYTNGNYQSKGNYFRLGIGYLAPLDAKHDFEIGLRYGNSTFDEKIEYVLESKSGIQSTFIDRQDRHQLNARWWEIVFYTDKKINKLFSIGMYINFRFLLDYTSFYPLDVYAIPGYGRSFDKVVPAVNLVMKVKLTEIKLRKNLD